ncbi:Pkinase-domain-containing protein [Mycena venus]|uniref:non-specific serine/threonine protein kinase n=1 Tax=Mycena venus TaxID=2733690 RepID=A0A8H6XF60_9AGAR|nr:Pkinase-domain-containing protein [Mycena venus]
MAKTTSIPLPPPEAASAPDKQPGMTRQDLLDKAKSPAPISTDAPDSNSSNTTPQTPHLHPQPHRCIGPGVTNLPRPAPAGPFGQARGVHILLRTPSRNPGPTVASEASQGGGHKFTLKDLLANGPKLSRRSSARSASSRHSADSGSEVSWRDGGSVKSGKSKEDKESRKSGKGEERWGERQERGWGLDCESVEKVWAHKWDRSEGDKMYAVKEFRKRRKTETEKEYVKKLTAEFCISSTLHHVNIVETVDLVQDEQGRWCEVMEFCPGGDLYAAIKKGGMSPSEVECCFKQILSGVGYLHSQGVAHRDIKPENLFFDTTGHLKIGDYGASTVYRLPWEATIHMSTGLCGSEPYIAPEQFLGKPYDARLVDIWACGIVYYCLHFQELPWRAAQSSDQLYAAYAAAAAATPPPPLTAAPPSTATNGHAANGSAPASATSTPSSSTLHTGTTTTQTHTVDRDRHGTNSTLQFPPTISNLSPRACRPLIRKMLEPDPKLRASIDEVLGCAWVKGVEVCWEVGDRAKHMHVNARAMAASVVGEGR